MTSPCSARCRLPVGLRQGGPASRQGVPAGRAARGGLDGIAAAGVRVSLVQDGVGRQVPVVSISGGTDVVTAFIGDARWCRSAPVSCPASAWEPRSKRGRMPGRPVTQQAGELVLTEPMPSMPVFFWNDPDGSRYRAAYFDKYPGVWCHGDWITIADRGSVVVQGRSDATLNRMGVRMGSAEIYNAVEGLPKCGTAWSSASSRTTATGCHCSSPQRRCRIRRGAAGSDHRCHPDRRVPRHVPDAILAVPGIPKTMTRQAARDPDQANPAGHAARRAVDRGAVDRPELLEVFA